MVLSLLHMQDRSVSEHVELATALVKHDVCEFVVLVLSGDQARLFLDLRGKMGDGDLPSTRADCLPTRSRYIEDSRMMTTTIRPRLM